MKRWAVAAMGAALLPWSPPVAAREPPAAGCIDLHDLAGGWRTGEREILIRSNEETGARLELDPACPPFAEGVDLETLAPEGWACPDGPAFVRGGDAICPVVRTSVLSAPALAEALRTWEGNVRPTVTLDRVEVRGQRHWRDRKATTDYCVDARFLRGWRFSDGEGLVVDVSPHRHAGQRYYRVETADACSDLSSDVSIRLESRNGGAAICGRPGDTVVLHDSDPRTRMGSPRAAATRERNCEITRVIPLPRE